MAAAMHESGGGGAADCPAGRTMLASWQASVRRAGRSASLTGARAGARMLAGVECIGAGQVRANLLPLWRVDGRGRFHV